MILGVVKTVGTGEWMLRKVIRISKTILAKQNTSVGLRWSTYLYLRNLRSGKAKFSAQDHLTITEARKQIFPLWQLLMFAHGGDIQIVFVYTTLCVSVYLKKKKRKNRFNSNNWLFGKYLVANNREKATALNPSSHHSERLKQSKPAVFSAIWHPFLQGYK